MDAMWLTVLMRVLHIVGVILFAGGLACVAFCFRRATRVLEPPFRETLERLVHGQFTRLAAIGIVLLLVSGIFNWMANNALYHEIGPAGQALIGTKVLLAVVLFALVIGRMMGMLGEQRPGLWMTIELLLVLAVVVVGAVLRDLRLDVLANTSAGGG